MVTSAQDVSHQPLNHLSEGRKEDDEIVPEGRKIEKKAKPSQVKAAVKRKRGKLSKREEAFMKKTCKNIFSLLAPTPPPSASALDIEPEEEAEDMEIENRDREKRLEKVRRR